MKLRVTELEQTCSACPAQWNGRTEDGRHVYVRYRWGWLQVGIGDTHDAAIDDKTISRALTEDEFAGVLSYDELKAATQDEVEWPL